MDVLLPPLTGLRDVSHSKTGMTSLAFQGRICKKAPIPEIVFRLFA